MKHSHRFIAHCVLEPLESRRLLTAPITEFPISSASVDIAPGPDGNLWFTESGNQIGRITPAGQIAEFSIPSTDVGPGAITAGADGNLWFIQGNTQIGRITPTGQVTVFSTNTYNRFIAADPDGDLWYTEYSVGKIGRITPDGQVTEYRVSYIPTGIAIGADSVAWFTEVQPPPPGLSQQPPIEYVGRITTGGEVTETRLPGLISNGATIGPDGDLWFTEYEHVPITSGSAAGGYQTVYYLSRMTASDQLSETRLTDATVGGDLRFGSDGNPWFADYVDNAIGRITLTGLVAEFSSPTPASRPTSIVAGPDGNIWFTEAGAAKLAEFRVAATDLRVTIPAQPVTGAAGQPLSYTIRVTNDSAFAATDAILTEIPATSNVPQPVGLGSHPPSVTASQGVVIMKPGGGFAAELGDLASGATATITIAATYSNPQTIRSMLAVHANESDLNSGDDTANLTTVISQAGTSSSLAPPHVLDLRPVRVKHKGVTAVDVRFDEAMESRLVDNVGTYHLVSVGKGKKPRLTAVRIASARYDTASNTVRLTLRKPFKTGTLRLTIDHIGLAAANGVGLGSGDYIANVPK